ncbi:CopD family protein [Phaeodactylibacter luteus]|uniref:Protoporphyrinogen IX oxidase n=1 Tax=Phaeodactylibacter luteus TaxID=1564516 RepID=A0A5C6RJ57_9BACT|nr:CopD family protein [Phaeodactylibacter luteus]TXB62478.1 TIGR00701 family protein [Phaeodactylibacter luteus]
MAYAIFFLKALHVVGFVSWFAGLFYLGRILVYDEEAAGQPEPEKGILKRQYQIMEWRVYRIICNPAMMITWGAGLAMLALGWISDRLPNYLSMGTPGWMHLKLLLLAGLTAYHLWTKGIIRRMQAGERIFNSWQYRLLNELPTLFLITISYTAVYGKAGSLNYGYLFGGLALFAGFIFWAARAYKKRRDRLEKEA